MWLDTSLLFIGIVALLNGIMTFFNTNATVTGLISLLALGFGGGASMYATYYFIYRHLGKDKSLRPSWFKIIAALSLAMLIWIALYSATAFYQPLLTHSCLLLPCSLLVVFPLLYAITYNANTTFKTLCHLLTNNNHFILAIYARIFVYSHLYFRQNSSTCIDYSNQLKTVRNGLLVY